MTQNARDEGRKCYRQRHSDVGNVLEQREIIPKRIPARSVLHRFRRQKSDVMDRTEGDTMKQKKKEERNVVREKELRKMHEGIKSTRGYGAVQPSEHMLR